MKSFTSITQTLSFSPAVVKPGLALGLFAVPLLLGHPQLLVGVVINTLLVIAAAWLPWQSARPLAVLPSLAAVSRGLLFGSLTMYLVYLLPFIWIGNLLLMYLANYFLSCNQNPSPASIIVASLAKTSFITISALILIKLSLIPSALLAAMSLVQLVTAAIGGFSALILLRYLSRQTS